MESKDEKSVSKQQMSKKVGKYILFMNEDQILGKGQFGVVYRAIDDSKKLYAVKMISMAYFKQHPYDSKTKKNAEQLKREIDVMKAAKHKNLVTLYDMQQSPNNLYLFLEYCNGGNLKDYLKHKNKLSQEEAVDVFRQLCEGYKVLNKQNILHRDIKLENVMLNDNTPKLCDFGFGKIVEDDVNEPTLQSYKCTPIYAAPQVLINEPYSSKCDVWSMGCMFYEMLFGYRNYPFNAKNQVELIENQKTVVDRYLKVPKNDFDPLVIDILQKMLRYHEKDRISWNDIWAHPIFSKKFDEILDESNILEDSNELSQSLIQNRKTLQKVQLVEEANVYKKRKDKNRQQSQVSTTVSSEDENYQYMKEVQKNEDKQYVSSKVDKLVLYYRNQGIFASIIMQNFWGVRNEYKLDTLIPHQIVFYLGGYYSYMLSLVNDIVNQRTYLDFEGTLKKSDFEVYVQSKAIQVTKQKINTDFKAAQNLFIDIKKSAVSEANKLLQSPETKNTPQIKEFLNFIQEENTDHNKYLERLQKLILQQLPLIDIDSIKTKNPLKGLDSLIIFSDINKIFPVQLYDKIDMKLFYEKQLNNKTEQEHIQNIQNYIKIKKIKK